MLMSGWKASSATKCVVHMTAPAEKPGEEQPAAAALSVHLARLREQEEGDEASERADRDREEDELRIVALQDLVAGEEHGNAPRKNAITFRFH